MPSLAPRPQLRRVCERSPGRKVPHQAVSCKADRLRRGTVTQARGAYTNSTSEIILPIVFRALRTRPQFLGVLCPFSYIQRPRLVPLINPLADENADVFARLHESRYDSILRKVEDDDLHSLQAGLILGNFAEGSLV